jgi:hypothetical protein
MKGEKVNFTSTVPDSQDLGSQSSAGIVVGALELLSTQDKKMQNKRNIKWGINRKGKAVLREQVCMGLPIQRACRGSCEHK